MSDLPELRLKPREERRLRAGHLWIYSNEVDTARTPLTAFAPGALCKVLDSRGKAMGLAYVNPRTLLAARLLTSNHKATIDADWFAGRIQSALAMRERLYDKPFYRLVYGEADGLPGLVVDRYGDICVAQMSTAGMDRFKAEIVAGLKKALAPAGILLANEVPMREIEGLPSHIEEIGKVPDTVTIEEADARFEVPIRTGQKTGWFYDQRDNRDTLGRFVAGKSVLDVYSYIGAWSLRALKAGAASAAAIDSSAAALEGAARNAELNGVALETIKAQAIEALREMAGRRKFDVVIVDPPALIKKKKDLEAGLSHYANVNRAAIELLAADGILVSCSCSHHLEADALQRILLRESRDAGRRLQILWQGGQGPDHPVHPAIPETRYLKAFFCRVP